MKKDFEFTRREFLKVARVGVGVGTAAVVAKRLTRLGEMELSTSEEILLEMFKETGVEVPFKSEDKYTQQEFRVGENNEFSVVEEIPNFVPDKETCLTLFDSVRNIPGAKHSFQLLVPFHHSINAPPTTTRYPSGSYLSRACWPAILQRSDYVEEGSTDIPRDRFLSEKSMVQIFIPKGLKMNDKLDLAADDVFLVPRQTVEFFSLMGRFPSNIKSFEFYPEITADKLIHIQLAHENAHAIVDKIRIDMSKGDMEKYWEMGKVTKLGGYSLEVNNPLLEMFARVNGWEKVPQVVATYRLDDKLGYQLLIKNTMGGPMVWDRDPNVWGKSFEKNIRVSPYATYSLNIGETFAEMYMASIYMPYLLTEAENHFFDIVHATMESSPEDMIKIITAWAKTLPEDDTWIGSKRIVNDSK